jgi:anti-anti-sigma factor
MPRPFHDAPCSWAVHSAVRDGMLVVAVAGAVDTSSAPALAAELIAHVEQSPSALLVDLGRVEFSCSSSVRALLDLHDQAVCRGVPLHLVAPRPNVVRTLENSGLTDVVPRHATLRDAVCSAGSSGGRRLRIAVVSERASPLGADLGPGAHVAQLSAALSGLGHEVVVYTRKDDSAVPERVRTDDGYDVVHVPAGPARAMAEDEVAAHLGGLAEFLVRQWRARPPDVVHSHHWTSGLAGVIAAHVAQVPVVHTYNALGTGRAGHRTDAETLTARRASWIVASSAQEAAELRRLGVRRTQVSVVPCGVDADLFSPDGPAHARTAPRRVVARGGSVQHNGFADVVTAVSVLADTELVIVGEGGQTTELRELAGGLGALDRVVFAGAVPHGEMPALLRSADVVVCVPWSDPFGVAALQAMACGVPVVAAAVGALTDIVVHKVTGLHVPAGSPRVLARALRQLLADDIWREEFGIAARDRVVARYSRARVVREASAVYERIVADRGSGREVG